MENIVFGIGITALTGALATVAGSAEDTESNIGSQGDPNSQVQLAPQMGFLHRIFNKAVAGEPPAYGLWCAL
ncbi:MAG: tetrahydromethanopterin S-methyltransferase subunit E, partial [Methanomicrobiales archaeon]